MTGKHNDDLCPPIAALLDPPGADAAVTEHLARCPACAGVTAICSLRAGDDDADTTAEGACAEWEPVVAAMTEGFVDDDTAAALASHLRRCPRCTETLATLSLLGDELSGLPDPAARLGRGHDAETATAWPERLLGPVRALVAPRQRWLWAVELAAVALLSGLLLGPWLRPGERGSQRAALSADPAVAGSEECGAPRPGLARVPCEAAANTAQAPPPQLQNPFAPPSAAPAGPPSPAEILDPWAAVPPPSTSSSADLIDPWRSRRARAASSAEILDPWAGPPPPRTSPSTEMVDPWRGRRARAASSAEILDPFAPPPSATAATGYLSVGCQPVCDVLVDGSKVGQSPIVKLPLSAGKHVVVTQWPDHGAQQRTIMIAAGESMSIQVKAEAKQEPVGPGHGSLSLSSVPHSQVLIDGQVVGNTPINAHRVKPGRHTVTFRRPDESRQRTVHVKAGQSLRIVVRFE